MSKVTTEEMLDHHRGMTRLADMVNPCHICNAIRDTLTEHAALKDLLKQAAYLLDYFHDRGDVGKEDACHIWFMEYHKALADIEVSHERI